MNACNGLGILAIVDSYSSATKYSRSVPVEARFALTQAIHELEIGRCLAELHGPIRVYARSTMLAARLSGTSS